MVKEKLGKLEDEVREGFSMRLSKEFTGVVQRVSGERRFLVIFKYRCEKGMASNQLTVVKLEKTPMNEEAEVPMISVIPDESVNLEKGYYNSVYVMLNFNKEGCVDNKEEQADMDLYPDEEEMEDVKLDDKVERHWRVFFEGNYGGVKNDKEILHAKRWDVYMN